MGHRQCALGTNSGSFGMAQQQASTSGSGVASRASNQDTAEGIIGAVAEVVRQRLHALQPPSPAVATSMNVPVLYPSQPSSVLFQRVQSLQQSRLTVFPSPSAVRVVQGQQSFQQPGLTMSPNPSAVPLVQGEPAARTSGLSSQKRRTFPPPSLYSGSRRKKAKSVAASVTTYVRDIVCLPQSYCVGSEKVNIPRGERRSALAEYGLVAKVQFNSAMDALEVQREICAVFAEPMGLHESGETTFPFEFLKVIVICIQWANKHTT